MRLRRPRVDQTQREVVELLRRLGFYVRSLSLVGDGFPDLCVARGGRMWLVEVKSPRSTHKKKSELKPAQVDFLARWPGPRIVILRGAADALHWSALVENAADSTWDADAPALS